MPSTATVTAKSGPDIQSTALVLNNTTKLDFQLDRKVVGITYADNPSKTAYYSMTGVTTVTFTIAANGDVALVMS